MSDTTDRLREALWLTALQENNGYLDAKPLLQRPGWYACISRMAFTYAILTGRVGDAIGYEDRWCYADYAAAKAALDGWDGEGEPAGWHRHPDSGRRRPDGDPGQEHIMV